jgi:predicted lipoprotein
MKFKIVNSQISSTIRLVWLMGLLLGIAALSACTVVTTAEATRIAEGGAFDAESFVETKWPEVISTVLEKSVELPTVLAAIKTDSNGLTTKDNLQQVATQYGLTTVGEAHVFMVKGRGAVTAVDTESSTGMMEVALEGYDGPIKVKFLIGPRIPNDETSVRDAVGFIKFGDFREQTEYGKVARELNKRVIRDVFEGLDRESLTGKSVSFYGVFTIRTFNLPGDIDASGIVVTPVQLEVGG